MRTSVSHLGVHGDDKTYRAYLPSIPIYIYIYIYIYAYIHTDTHTQYTAIETGSGNIDKGISATESCASRGKSAGDIHFHYTIFIANT